MFMEDSTTEQYYAWPPYQMAEWWSCRVLERMSLRYNEKIA